MTKNKPGERVDVREWLYESLQQRMRPEDVAELVYQWLKDKLTEKEKMTLRQATRHSLYRGVHQITSMTQTFRKPVSPDRQVGVAGEIFHTAYKMTQKSCLDVDKVAAFLAHISKEIRKKHGRNDFKGDRLPRATRKKMEISRRRYNKLFRFLCRLEKKVETYRLELKKYDATLISKGSLASRITRKEFMSSTFGSAFVAYYVARAHRRSVFTNQSQDRPYDHIADILFKRFKKHPTALGWKAIAKAMPTSEVLNHLADSEKMDLLAEVLVLLRGFADILCDVYAGSNFDLEKMIVQRGDDSSTWNAVAGAWNAIRKAWFGLADSLGMHEQIDTMCFGKVMRLMAADVSSWHLSSGGDVDPDTLIWSKLPPPWEVFEGNEQCSKKRVIEVCERYKVDPVKRGWVSPVPKHSPVEFKPTPELVHGVVVSHPQLALVLRKAGWFSGKRIRETSSSVKVNVRRDEHGFALEASVDRSGEE